MISGEGERQKTVTFEIVIVSPTVSSLLAQKRNKKGLRSRAAGADFLQIVLLDAQETVADKAGCVDPVALRIGIVQKIKGEDGLL